MYLKIGQKDQKKKTENKKLTFWMDGNGKTSSPLSYVVNE